MVAFNKFNCLTEDLAEKAHDFSTDTLKIMLSNTAPNASNTTTSNITEITPGNGYSAGGNAVTVTASSQTGGTYKLVADDVDFTATSGGFGPFQYAVLYNTANSKLIGWWNRGSAITLSTAGDKCTINFDPTNGVLQIA